jgi:spore coat protein CotF
MANITSNKQRRIFMAAELGAYEIMELHGVLTNTIDGINQLQLYRCHVQDAQLRSILDNQVNFMAQEYNNMVQTVQQQSKSEAIPYRKIKNVAPEYGLRNPGPNAPNISADEMDDKDVASGALGMHKASAMLKMGASLEFADPTLRRMLQQSAINCSEQSFEVWNYMNQKGMYQIPTMLPMTTSTIINSFDMAQRPQFS